MFKSNSAQIIVFSAQPTVNKPKRCLINLLYVSDKVKKKKNSRCLNAYSLDWIR